jgi:hypothetical protein
MKRSIRAGIGVMALSLGLIGATPGSATAQSVSRDPLSAVLADLVAQQGSNGGGTFNTSEGQKVLAALAATGQSSGPMGGLVVVPATKDPGGGGRMCTGTFDDNSAVVTLQESNASIPWGVRLKPMNSVLGEVAFSNQSFADNYQANSYQPHYEPWNYWFHGSLANPFSIVGSSLKHQMKIGSAVSFLWTWHSISKPASGGYAWVNCTFDPGVN